MTKFPIHMQIIAIYLSLFSLQNIYFVESSVSSCYSGTDPNPVLQSCSAGKDDYCVKLSYFYPNASGINVLNTVYACSRSSDSPESLFLSLIGASFLSSAINQTTSYCAVSNCNTKTVVTTIPPTITTTIITTTATTTNMSNTFHSNNIIWLFTLALLLAKLKFI